MNTANGCSWPTRADEWSKFSAGKLTSEATPRRVSRAGRESRLVAEWSRPVFADERPVYARLPTFGFGRQCPQTAVTLNRSQRSSTCRAFSFSARSLRSPLRSKMA